MMVLCDDNETYDNAPRPEAHPSLPLELMYAYSKLNDDLFDHVTRTMATTEEFNQNFKVTCTLRMTRHSKPFSRHMWPLASILMVATLIFLMFPTSFL